MEYKKIGKQTVKFAEKPILAGRGNVAGEKEGQARWPDTLIWSLKMICLAKSHGKKQKARC